MATIYSIRMADLTLTAASATPYTVPSGFVAVVRSIQVLSIGSGATGEVLRSGGIGAMAWFTSTLTAQFFPFDVRAVLNAGESLECLVTTGTARFFVSGYQLQGP
jgi:hypothetical protein